MYNWIPSNQSHSTGVRSTETPRGGIYARVFVFLFGGSRARRQRGSNGIVLCAWVCRHCFLVQTGRTSFTRTWPLSFRSSSFLDRTCQTKLMRNVDTSARLLVHLDAYTLAHETIMKQEKNIYTRNYYTRNPRVSRIVVRTDKG
jgi:hypothetical protein